MSKLFATAAAIAGLCAIAFVWMLAAFVFDHWPGSLVHATGSLTGVAGLTVIAVGVRDHLAKRIESARADQEVRVEAARRYLAEQVAQSEQRIRQQMTEQLQHILILFGHYVHDEEKIAEHLAVLRAEGGDAPPPHHATVTHLHRRS